MNNNIYILFLFSIFLFSCKENYTPKPYGYYRIEFSEKDYTTSNLNLPYQFDIAKEASLEPDFSSDAEPFWTNIVYPKYNARINLSYKKITTDTSLFGYLQDCHRMAYAHTIKAESIEEKFFRNENGIFGILYTIDGNTASSSQFFITDSTTHFLRGALYFNEHPHRDSLSPVIEYLTEDIIKLMESIHFSNSTKQR